MAPLLDEKMMRALTRLRLGTHDRVPGRNPGDSKNLDRGSSIEFTDYREYEPGDDYRSIDWNIYSRLDRLFVKVFSDEHNKGLRLIIDTSESMAMGDPSKMRYATQIAAALAYVALWNGDEVRLGSVTNHMNWHTPWWSGRHRLPQFLRSLNRLDPQGPTSLKQALERVDGDSRYFGDVTVLISDLFDSKCEQALASLSRLRTKSVLIHLLSPDDWLLNDTGEFDLIDQETGDVMTVYLDDHAVQAFAEKATAWLEEVRSACLAAGISCYQLDTSHPFQDLLFTQFRKGGLLR